ncbi:MAG: hypothetical protein IPN60_19485 [Saprospiraceae bacterium]|nr:hypothetical protein [Candidatus Opimibacter skivensis]MBL0008661.1 hypothetical protein [Candidatus Opimibacter skivensis]MBP6680095.1 hypothetical protein [Saprospiraceae bacterium]MBP8086476.1 hypothetical protein [Saprospiraceae bacterium]
MIMAVVPGQAIAQEEQELLSLLGREETTEYAAASFKTNRVINLHSLESTTAGVLDVKISHRFGYLNGGIYDLFGLDESSVRLGADYGVSDRLTIGVGRSSYEKTYDGFIKYKLLRQSTGLKNMPVSMAILGTAAITTLKWADPNRDNLFSSRVAYTTQLIIGRKFSNGFSLQFSPSWVHRNLVATSAEKNDVIALGFAGRIKLNKRLSFNAEYIYVLPDQLAEQYTNSLSIGFDIETGGHVFQLHFTNSTSMIEKGFITETLGEWGKGEIHFGFNISRVFTVVKPKS